MTDKPAYAPPGLPNAEDLPTELPLVFTRFLKAPLDLVWRAWTEPEMIAKWWAPEPFTSHVVEWDARPGGHVVLTMLDPDGGEHPMTGVFGEVEPMRRIVLTGEPLDEAASGSRPMPTSSPTAPSAASRCRA